MDIGKMVNVTAKVLCHTKMKIYIQAIGRMARKMAKEPTLLL